MYEDLKRNTPVSGQIFLFLLFLSFLSTFLSTLLFFLEKYEVNNVNISSALVEKCSNNYQHRRITKNKNKSVTTHLFSTFLATFLAFLSLLAPFISINSLYTLNKQNCYHKCLSFLHLDVLFFAKIISWGLFLFTTITISLS